MYHDNIVGTLIIHPFPLHIAQVLRLPGAVNLEALLNAFLRITLTVSEMVKAKNRVTFSLPILFNLSSVTKMQPYIFTSD